jgi:hypothetical protein
LTTVPNPYWFAARDLDLLGAAFQLDHLTLEAFLDIPEGAIKAWRVSDPLGWDEGAEAAVELLKGIWNKMWQIGQWDDYAEFWRRQWSENSPLTGSSPLSHCGARARTGLAELDRALSAGLGL